MTWRERARRGGEANYALSPSQPFSLLYEYLSSWVNSCLVKREKPLLDCEEEGVEGGRPQEGRKEGGGGGGAICIFYWTQPNFE